MKKEINKYSDIREKIINGLDKIAEPVIATLSPMGTNSIFELEDGNIYVSNDGIAIASQIELEDPIENSIAQIVRASALRTNAVAGDGTTTSILLTQKLVKKGFKLLDDGWNPMELKRKLDDISEIVSKEIQNSVKKIKNDEDLYFVAKVSANSDESIAKDVVKAIKSAGDDGLIFIEENQRYETEILEESGFMIPEGMFSPYLANQPRKMQAKYNNVNIFVTDKALYHAEEALSIMEPLAKTGVKDIVIIAKDFIGESVNTFLTNHIKGNMRILLVKAPENIEDLADYLGCKVFTDKSGQLTTKDITPQSFGNARLVVSMQDKTIIQANETKQRTDKVKMLRDIIKNAESDIDINPYKERLARMTSGTITMKIGGNTPQELRERLYRYEDSVNATRTALKDGYVVGGGITLIKAFNASKKHLKAFPKDLIESIEEVSKAPLKQIAINCNVHLPTMLENAEKGLGYNADTGKFGDLEAQGIIEPLKVLQLAWENAFSSAGTILSSTFIITNKEEKKDDKN